MKHDFLTFSFKIFTLFLIIFFLLSYNINVFGDDIEIDENVYTQLDDSSIATSSNKNSNNLNLNARSCVVFDRVSKQVIYGKNEYNKVKMASTTKIMTATIVLEKMNLNETIEVSKKAANTGGSRLGLKTGDKITILDLLYGLMLCSGNDAAVALAECTAGSVQDFSVLMNEKALELELTNSHFESPHGLDSDEHYTTAYELAKLSDYALKNKMFAQIVGSQNHTITLNGQPKNLSNTNELLGNLNGVYGIKTGFTNGANRCLVTACKRGKMDIICVVLGCDTKNFRTQDSKKLIEYTFENFEYVNIEELILKKFENWKSENENYISINKSSSNNIELSICKLENPIIPLNKEIVNNIDFIINVEKFLDAPINQGDVVGNISVFSNSINICNTNVIINNYVSKKNSIDYLYSFFKDYCTILSNYNNFL